MLFCLFARGFDLVLKKKWIFIPLLMGLALVLGSYLPPSSYRAAALLRIPELPSSARDVNCWSEGWMEDDFTQCIGRARVEEMADLMAGWNFAPTGYCSEIPTQSNGATHCYKYDAPEFGGLSYVAFSYNKDTGWFHASTYRQ